MVVLFEKLFFYVNVSVVGYYGILIIEIFIEVFLFIGIDFLVEMVKKWENEVLKVMEFNICIVLIRFGVILGKDGGVFFFIVFFYKLFVGGIVGLGE